MIVEMELNLKDEGGESPIVHSLAVPEGWQLTGGAIFLEKKDGLFSRFAFRIDNLDGEPEFVVLEEAPAPAA